MNVLESRFKILSKDSVISTAQTLGNGTLADPPYEAHHRKDKWCSRIELRA
jgi:hypothetical protein